METRDEAAACKLLARKAIGLLRTEGGQLDVAEKAVEECRALLGSCLQRIPNEPQRSGWSKPLVDLIDTLSTELDRGCHASVLEERGGKVGYQAVVASLVAILSEAVGGLPANDDCLRCEARRRAPVRDLPAFVVEDVTNETQPQVPKLLLVCAMYDWESSATHNTWSSRGIGTETRQLLQTVFSKIRGSWGASLDEGDIVMECMEHVLELLRPAILWRRPHADDPMQASHIPHEIDRLVAAHKLFWCVSHMRGPKFSQQLGNHVFPLVFSTIDDPSPSVQTLGLMLLGVLNDKVPTSWMIPWREVLLNTLDCAIKQAVASGDESVWGHLFPLASRIVIKLEGKHPRKAGYDMLMCSMVEGVGMKTLQKPHRLIVLVALRPLVEAMGLVTVRYFADLIPMLCGYCCSEDADTMGAALAALALVVKHTWPRIPLHAAMLWRIVETAYQIAHKQEHHLTETVEDGIRRLCQMLLASSWDSSMLFLESSDWMNKDGNGLRDICRAVINELQEGFAEIQGDQG